MTGSVRLSDLLRLHDAARGRAVLKETERGRVTRVACDETSDAVCKEDSPRRLGSRVGRVLRGSRAARCLMTARALAASGFAVPEALGALEEGERSIYFARYVGGPNLSDALASVNPITARVLALQAAELAARLHLAGFAFRDLKPPNLVVASGGRLVPVDLDDVSRPRRLPRRIAWRNLAALDAYAQWGPRPLPVRVRLEALVTYSRLREMDPEVVLAAVLPLSRAKRRRLVERLGSRHGA